jgi:hypothetical protein
MDVKLPNGTIIRGVPEGTSKDEVMRRAIASGIANPEDFGQSATDSSGEPSLSMTEAPAQRPQQADPSILDMIAGPMDAAISAGTGMTFGAAGGALGALEGVFEAVKQGKLGTSEAQQIIESQIAERMQQGTWTPKTKTGQEIMQGLGEIAGALPAASPLVPEAAIAAQSARATVGLAGNVARSALPQAKPQAMGGLSIGAAEIPIEQVRTQQAQDLPVPIQLTKGQAAKDFEQQRFERETAKMNDIGDPIRQRYTEQNLQLQQNLDSFIDATGTTLPETSFMLETGQLIDKAIRSKAAQDKTRIRAAYKEAEKAGELNNPVDLSDLAAYINENRAGRTSAPILNTIADEILVQEVGSGRIDDGSLQIGDITLGQAEKLRQSINKFAKDTDPNDLRVASELKQIIDQSTENAGGDIYRRARTLRRQYADQYENIGIIRDILGKKRGSDDRKIATENIVNKVVFSGSVDDLNNVRKTLQTQGAEGMAAWKEMQAATLRQIRDEATKNMARDQNGNPIVSAAGLNRIVTSLDKNGKLEKLYGKKGAEQIKLLNDVAKDILISQPGTVNSSNTSTALLAVLEMGAYGGPFVSAMKFARDKVKDRAVRKRVEQALSNQEVKK